MLILAGPGLTSFQYYSRFNDAKTLQMQEQQGDTLNTMTCILYDPTCSIPLVEEDDIVVVDELDPNGFPCTNLLSDPSFEGSYSAGVAPGWNGNNLISGVSAAASSTALYGSHAQSIELNNVANGTTDIGVWASTITLPTDQNQNPIVALPYFASVYARVVGAAAVGCTAELGIEWYDASSTYLGTSATPVLLGSAYVNAWTRWSVNAIPPVGAAKMILHLYLTTTNATNSVTLLFDGAQLEYAAAATAIVSATQTALQAGMYPTPYCDSSQPGCYTDTDGTGLYYRQLRLFGGFIKVLTDDFTGQGPGRNLQVDATEYGLLLQETLINLNVNSESDVTVIAVCAAYAKAKGCLVGLDVTTYVYGIATISGMNWQWTTFRDVLNAICNQTNAAYYVDPHKYLHYQVALALSAPFALSQIPDMVTSFPFQKFIRVRDNTQGLTSHTVEGGNQLSGPQPYSATGNGSTTLWTVNGGDPISQVDSVLVNGVAQQIGVIQHDTLGVGGIQVIYDPNAGTIQFNTAPANLATIAVVFRFMAQLLVRVHNPTAEGPHGRIRRVIEDHQKYDYISTIQSGVDRATGELRLGAKANVSGTLTITTPHCPPGVPIRAGMAVAITYNPISLATALFQVQQVTTTALGNGYVQRDLTLGYYRPGSIELLAQSAREAAQAGTAQSSGSVLNDATSFSDGWSMTDNIPAPVSGTIAKWGPTSGAGTWSGATVWG